MFFGMYHKESFAGDTFLNDYQLDGFLEVPLTYDDSLVVVPKRLAEKAEKVLKSTPGGSFPAFENEVREFIKVA
jgi:hypothetical protein